MEQGAEFFGRLWTEARVVSDMDKQFYNAFGVARGGLREMLGADVWACGVRTAMKGHRGGLVVGDPWTMPTTFVVQGERVLWGYEGKHAGDHPNWSQIPALAGMMGS